MTAATAEIRRHWTRLTDMGCILTLGPAEIAHCHGGSMKTLGPAFQPGMAQKQNHWLVLPLSPRLHRIGPESLDGGSVEAWEAHWGTQIRLLKLVCQRVGYDVFELAGVTSPP